MCVCVCALGVLVWAEKPCVLFCSPVGRDVPVLMADRVMDGTSCGPFEADLCLHGRCQVQTQRHTHVHVMGWFTQSMIGLPFSWWPAYSFVQEGQSHSFLGLCGSTNPTDSSISHCSRSKNGAVNWWWHQGTKTQAVATEEWENHRPTIGFSPFHPPLIHGRRAKSENEGRQFCECAAVYLYLLQFTLVTLHWSRFCLNSANYHLFCGEFGQSSISSLWNLEETQGKSSGALVKWRDTSQKNVNAHYLLTTMPMKGWVKCLSPQSTLGVLQPNPIQLK